jgi:hypothetical protein
MKTRVLFLDDSGKPDVNHMSGAVVLAGFSIPSERVPTLSRRVLGAKAKHFPGRGRPASWEIKAAEYIKPNPWKRRKNREFASELVRIVAALGGTVYSVAINKSKMLHPMTLSQTTPLQLQILIEHFELECRYQGETGLIVADWSSHHADQHASSCVASFVASRKLNLHPSVYYASSFATEAVQLADLFAGVRRRVTEGDIDLVGLSDLMDDACSLSAGQGLQTIKGHSFRNRIQLFQ